jgi:hypothetical protein
MGKRYRPVFEVIVGNIGMVHLGTDYDEAMKHYAEYIEQSRSNVGRAGGESVILSQDGEPMREYIGTLDSNKE